MADSDDLFDDIDEDATLAVLDAEESKFTLTQSQAPPRPAPSAQPPPPKRLKTSAEPQGWVASTARGVKRQASLNDYDDLDVSVRSDGTYAIQGARPTVASRVPGPLVNMGAPAQRTTPAPGLVPGTSRSGTAQPFTRVSSATASSSTRSTPAQRPTPSRNISHPPPAQSNVRNPPPGTYHSRATPQPPQNYQQAIPRQTSTAVNIPRDDSRINQLEASIGELQRKLEQVC
jgi:hypothetical protein